VAERFPTTKVLEFYASVGGETILANVKGTPIGSMGRPLPGTAEVRVAGFALRSRSLQRGADGLGRECDTDEVGLLLSRVGESTGTDVLRGVFEPGDAWRSTGDLFLADEHRDLWLVDPVSAIIDTARGPVLPAAARMALGSIPAVDLYVAYPVRDGDADVLVAAVTLCPDAELSAGELDRAFERVPRSHRPAYVQVVRSIPVTTWHRPVWQTMQKAGVPEPNRQRRVWGLDPDGHYQELVSA
jgi:putative long chain acyl-CoA synthase